MNRHMRPLSRLQVRLGITALLVALAGPAFPQAPSAGLEKTGDFRVLIDATGKLKSAAPLDANLGDALSRAIIGAAK